MKSHVKASALSAAKWAFWLCAAFILAPLVIGLASGVGVNGKLLAEKLAVGVLLFPLLFAWFWLYGIFKRKVPITGLPMPERREPSLQSTSTQPAATKVSAPTQERTTKAVQVVKKPSIWNFVAIAVGAFMILFLFVPQLVSGTLAPQYYLGAAFWVGVIVYCWLNIKRTGHRRDS